jgi:hypothetical protein
MKKIKIFYRVDNPQGRALDALFHKIKGKLPAESAMQEEVIRALVLNQDWTRVKGKEKNGKEFSVLVEYICRRAAANDRNFFIKLGRQLRDNRPYKNDEIKDFLFTHWDATRGTMTNGVGLKHFTDEQVLDLLNFYFGKKRKRLSLAAYRDIRTAANLRPEQRKIKQVAFDDSGNVTILPFK